MKAKKTLLLASVVFLFSSFSVAQMHSTSVPSTASMPSDPGGQMGVGASAASLTAVPSHSLADWRNWSSDGSASGWVAPSLWVTSSGGGMPSRPVRMAGGGPQEVVLPAARVVEHTTERVQAMPRIGN